MQNSNVFFALFAAAIMLSSTMAISYSLPPDHVELPDPAKFKAAPFQEQIIVTENYKAVFTPHYTTIDAPANNVIPGGGTTDGIPLLQLFRTDVPIPFFAGCSGGLLPSGSHVITAAHCVTDDNGVLTFDNGTAFFNGDSGFYAYNITNVKVHPDWNGSLIVGNDLAVLTLNETVAAEITRYDLNKAKNEVGSTVDKAGWGVGGFASTGFNATLYPFGIMRGGQNTYDALGDTMLMELGAVPNIHFVPGSVLQYDMDNGNPANDAFGFFFGIPDLGVGIEEANSAPGDSGGISINSKGQMTAVTSYGLALELNDGTTTDCHPNLVLINGILINFADSSCGEFSGDTRISKYANWISNQIKSGDGSDGGPSKDKNCPPNSQNPACTA